MEANVMSKANGGMPPTRAVGAFLRTGFCSRALFDTLDRAFGDPHTEEECASVPLAGGIMQNGYQCGMVWGSALAAGARAYRLFGPGPQAEIKAIVAAQKIVESFRARHKSIDCFEIIGTNWKTATAAQIVGMFLKGGPLRCFRMAGSYPPVALADINAAFSGELAEAPPAPVSCAALLARKMGASDAHAVMVAGFAGGIGLSGGACGALGAAIWLAGLKTLEGGGKVPIEFPAGQEAVERFVECIESEFACATIVGRKFESVEDHAAYVCGGGCANIIDALAAG
jgi:Putative redox-active protein (C_GCAxxG_C_C)